MFEAKILLNLNHKSLIELLTQFTKRLQNELCTYLQPDVSEND